MNYSSPIVSVLMTAYNREKYIAAAIESVLASTLKDFEIIVVDDCSKDSTLQIARSFEARDSRVKVFINELNLGDYPNRNMAAKHASGKYIKYLDADDMIYPHGLEVMVNAMEKFPEAGFGLASKPDDHVPYPVCVSPKQIYMESFYGYGHFDRAPGSSIIKREVFEEEKGFSGKQFVGDQEIWLILGRKYNMVKFPLDLYWNRIHDDQQAHLERKVGKTISQTRRALINNALEHPSCPLDMNDAIKIKNRITLERKKGAVLEAISRLKSWL